MLLDCFDKQKTLVPHLAGFLFGFLGGFLVGHRLQKRSALWASGNLVFATVVCASLLVLTARGVDYCAAKAVAHYARHEAARDRERHLLARFQDLLQEWVAGNISDLRLREGLRSQIIPDWEKARVAYHLQLPAELAELERRPLSLRELMKLIRSVKPSPDNQPKGPLSNKEYDDAYRLYFKLRLDNWRALADELEGQQSLVGEALLDYVGIEMMREGLDDEANVDNPLRKWFEFGSSKKRLNK